MCKQIEIKKIKEVLYSQMRIENDVYSRFFEEVPNHEPKISWEVKVGLHRCVIRAKLLNDYLEEVYQNYLSNKDLVDSE